MLWQKKKKRKKATKSKAVTQTAPHQLAEELPQTTEPEEKEETPKQKKPAGKKCKKVLSPEKAFLDAFGRLTNRYRAWDVWRDFITMFACSLSNPLDKEHRDKREALYLEVIKKYNKQDQELFPELVLVVAQDIDKTVALMCYIQLSLLGVAGYVKVGNSLTEPMTDNDNKENYWYTPMYFSPVWTMRRIFGGR